jgi:predicted PurR-regulated permease PerM
VGAILAYSSWHPYTVLTRWLGNRRGLAALICVLIATVIVLGPFVYAGASFSAHIDELTALVNRYTEHGIPQLPDWLSSLPFVGPQIESAWNKVITADSETVASLRKLIAPVGHALLGAGLSIGPVSASSRCRSSWRFLLYRRRAGRGLGTRRHAPCVRRSGRPLAVTGRQYGQGRGLRRARHRFVQAVLAGIGFWIAGVPGAAILGFITFFLSVVPMGPPLAWIPAALWLYHTGETGWAIFMVVWGAAVVGMADNVIKPLLISKGTGLPLIWIMMGVLGGALAFSFLGVFIGPTVLAVAYALLRDWTIGNQERASVTAVTAPPPSQLTPDA